MRDFSGVTSGIVHGPLSTIAFWNRPALRGDTMWAHTDHPPADSPNSVFYDPTDWRVNFHNRTPFPNCLDLPGFCR